MLKFVCETCGGNKIEELVTNYGVSTEIDLTGDEPEYGVMSETDEILNVRFVCSDCGQELFLKNGKSVCDLDDLKQYFEEK